MIQRQVLGLLLAGALFLLFLPMFVWMMKPHRDLRYHLGDTRLTRLGAATFSRDARTAAHVQVEGTIDAATLAERRSLLNRSFGFLFAVDGYPRTLIVHLRGGPLFEQLSRVSAMEDDGAALLAALQKPVTLRGRLYDGQNFLEPFKEYALADEADPESYIHKILKDRLDTTPRIFTWLEGKTPDSRSWWLLAVDEIPRPGHLWETHVPVFCLGIFMGLVALVAVVLALGRKRPVPPPPGPPAGDPPG